MDAARKKRLEELKKMFRVTEVNGDAPMHNAVGETIAFFLNKKYGREVVVRRERKPENK